MKLFFVEMNVIVQDRKLWQYLSFQLTEDVIPLILLYMEKMLWDYQQYQGIPYRGVPYSCYSFKWQEFLKSEMFRDTIASFIWYHEDNENDDRNSKRCGVEICSKDFLEYVFLQVGDGDEPFIRQYLLEYFPTFRQEIDIIQKGRRQKEKKINLILLNDFFLKIFFFVFNNEIKKSIFIFCNLNVLGKN